eukprot:jgi/Chrzof1/14663/Cz09g11080.t1
MKAYYKTALVLAAVLLILWSTAADAARIVPGVTMPEMPGHQRKLHTFVVGLLGGGTGGGLLGGLTGGLTDLTSGLTDLTGLIDTIGGIGRR